MKGEQGAGEGSAHHRQNLHKIFKKNKGHDRKGFVVRALAGPEWYHYFQFVCSNFLYVI